MKRFLLGLFIGLLSLGLATSAMAGLSDAAKAKWPGTYIDYKIYTNRMLDEGFITIQIVESGLKPATPAAGKAVIWLDGSDVVWLLTEVANTSIIAGATGGAAQLSELSDVSSVTYTAGKVLRGDGSGFVSAFLGFNDLSDATITAPATGDMIYYTGSAWIKLSAGTSTYLLQANGAAAPTWVTVPNAPDLTLSAQATGNIAYYDGSDWVVSAQGVFGTYLKSMGAGSAPSWDTPAGAGDMLKTTYDTDTDDIVDGAETVSDGVYVKTAQEISEHIDVFNFTTPATGSVVYFDGSDWIDLDTGTANKYLKTQGAGLAPMWDTPPVGDMLAASYDTGDNGVVDIAEDLTLTSEATGNIAYYDGSNWVRLAQGVYGTYLMSQGSGLLPIYQAPSGAGDMLRVTYDTDGDDAVDYAEAVSGSSGNKTGEQIYLHIESSSDPHTVTFLQVRSPNCVTDADIDWGTSASQVSTDDITEGTNKFECTTGADPITTSGTVVSLSYDSTDFQLSGATALALKSVASVYGLTEIQADCGGDFHTIGGVDANTTYEVSIATIETNITNLQTTMATVEASIATIETNITNLQTTMATVEASVVTAEADIVALETSMATAESNITALETSMASVEASIATIEGWDTNDLSEGSTNKYLPTSPETGSSTYYDGSDWVLNNSGAMVNTYFGSIAAGTADERPVFVAPYDCELITCEVANASNASINATSYTTISLRDKGSDGSADNQIAAISTDTTALSAFNAVSLGTLDSTHKLLSDGDVVTLKKAETAGGMAVDELLVMITYKRR